MKVRIGFISNSSSSSFVCSVCGREESGYDLSMEEVEMVYCENGHILGLECLSESISEKDKNARIREDLKKCSDIDVDKVLDEDLEDLVYEYGIELNVPENCCPICSFLVHDAGDMARYLEKIYKVSKAVVFKEVKSKNSRRKKLYDSEYIDYVCLANNTSVHDMVKKIKEDFGSYKNFNKFIRSRSE